MSEVINYELLIRENSFGASREHSQVVSVIYLNKSTNNAHILYSRMNAFTLSYLGRCYHFEKN